MAAPNIASVSSWIGKTAVAKPTVTNADVLTNSAASGKVFKVNAISVANINGTSTADITINVNRGGTDYALASTITIPADATLVVVSRDNAFYLEEGDAINATASATGYLDVVISYEEIS